MKKIKLLFLPLLIIVLVLSFTIMPACKNQSAETTTAAETKVAEETTNAETTAAETTEPAKEVLIKIQDFQGASTNYTDAYTEIFALYQQSHPNVKFDRKALGWDEYAQSIKAQIAGGDIPDLIGLYQGPDTIDAVNAGLILPLKDKIEGDQDWLNALGKDMIEFPDLLIEGDIYQVAFDAIISALIYHKSILTDAGVDKFPVTLEEFKAANEKLKAKNIYLSYDCAAWVQSKEIFNQLIAQQTGSIDMINDAIDKKISWQNDTFLNALKVIQYVSIEASAPDAATAAQDYAGELSRFAAKKYWGKWYAGEWEIGDYAKLAPEDVKAGEFGLANGPIPTADSNPNIYIGGPGQTYSVNAKSANVDVAIDFLKFLSSEDVVKIMLKHDIHPAGKIASPEQYTENPLLKEFLKLTTVEGFKTVPFSMKSAEVEQQMINNFGKMYLGQLTPEQFLQDMDKTFQNE